MGIRFGRVPSFVPSGGRLLVRRISCLGSSALRFLSTSMLPSASLLLCASLLPSACLFLGSSSASGGRGRLLPMLAFERLDRVGFRLSVIVCRMQGRIFLRCLDAGALGLGWRDVLRLSGGLFLCGGPGLRATRAVIASAAAGVGHDLVVGIGVVNHGGVHPGHGRVIAEGIAGPFAPIIAASSVAVAVINPAVKPNRRPPVSLVEIVTAATIAPVAGRPEKPDARRSDPDSRDPVVTEIGVGPVAGRPNIARGWTQRLFVDRDRRWSDRNRNADLCGGRSQREPGKEQSREGDGGNFCIHFKVQHGLEKRDAPAPRSIQTN